MYTEEHYTQLQTLFARYAASQDLCILGFPCNQFGKQEPWPNEQIKKFVRKEFGVQFDLFSKIDVNGVDAIPLFKFIRDKQRGTHGHFIKWNFTKIIVDRNGKPVKRLAPAKEPLAMLDDLEPYFTN